MWILVGSGKPQWTVLKHNGPFFPSEYIPHNIPIILNGKKITLPTIAEEYATLYSKYIGSNYEENNKFKKNFWNDFKKLLPNDMKINNLEEIDFSLIREHYLKEAEKKREMTKEQKQKIKEENEKIEEPYKYCIIDGSKEKVGNYKIEPPGIFLGRGNHPKIGMIKKRINPEDITINLSKDAEIPKPNISNHKWGKIIHNRHVIWLATWKDNVTGKIKYIFTSVESKFKSKSDEKKFNLAKRLKKRAAKIREQYENDLEGSDDVKKQLATALYFIDHLALRVGGKKNTKEKADTVGVTSLRIEHIELTPPNNIKLDFLGKDSIRYCKRTTVLNSIYKNLENFIKGKNKKDLLFDLISSSSLNEYLSSFMKNLTAKVWRTYNASMLFQKELDKIRMDTVMKLPESERVNYIISMFYQANTMVALLCNHQKTVSASHDKQIERFNERIKKARKQKRKANDRMRKTKDKEKKNNYKEKIVKLEAKIKLLKIKKNTKSQMKNVSLETSKKNYIDPRIIFAFSDKFNVTPEKLGFSSKFIERFKWATNVDKNFRF